MKKGLITVSNGSEIIAVVKLLVDLSMNDRMNE